jgi:probable HAF family extracellular repeat protein
MGGCMRTLTLLLASLMGLAVTACSTVYNDVYSVMPVGDDPVYLEPKEWEGLWASNTYDDSLKSVRMSVVDAAGGILEYGDPEDCTDAVRAVVRQHRSEGGKAKFIGHLTEGDDWGYVWGKYQRVGNALIIWPPVPDEFQKLIETGEISGQSVGSGDLLIDPLSKDPLDRISIDVNHELFNYKFDGGSEAEVSFPGKVWLRISTVLADGATRCRCQPDLVDRASESAVTTGMPVLRYSVSDLGKRSDTIGECADIGRMLMLGGSQPAINNAGQVVGVIAGDDQRPGRPFLWTRSSGMTELGDALGQFIDPYAISDAGRVAGSGQIRRSGEAGDDDHALLWDPGHGITDLGTLGGKFSCAYSLNDLGQVVGMSELPNDLFHAFLWEGGVMNDLGGLGGDISLAHGINESSQVVGMSVKSADGDLGTARAFLWTRSGGMTDLGTLGGISSEASAVNDKGEVVGTANTTQGYNRAFKWHPDTGMVDLGTLGGRDSSANAINNAGQAVGWSEITWGDTRQKRAFLWDHGNMIDLSSLPDVKAAGWSELTEAADINDQGQIVGFGVRDGKHHIFLLTPEPPIVNGH